MYRTISFEIVHSREMFPFKHLASRKKEQRETIQLRYGYDFEQIDSVIRDISLICELPAGNHRVYRKRSANALNTITKLLTNADTQTMISSIILYLIAIVITSREKLYHFILHPKLYKLHGSILGIIH